MIEIIEIDLKKKKERERFINFDYQIYQNDSYWVAPLRMEIGQRLDVKKHPFYKLGAIQCFMAIKDGKDAGRIAAINNMKYNEFHGSKVGFFGFFECIHDQEVADMLQITEATCRWHVFNSRKLLKELIENASITDKKLVS
jgi:hypothetical protein